MSRQRAITADGRRGMEWTKQTCLGGGAYTGEREGLVSSYGVPAELFSPWI